MDLPWDRLGLGSFLAADAEGILWFEAGRPRMGEEPPTQGLPLVAYSEEGAGRGSIDLGLLGRTVLPTLADSSLAGLCTRFSVPIEGSARREAVGRLLLAVLQEASTFSPDLLSLLSELLPAPTGELLGRLVPLAKPLAARPQEAPLARGTGPVSADAVLGPDGEVAQGFPTYEDRPGQRRMAREIEVILDHGGTLAVEAGPGTGKTFAYLVPAILRLRAQPTARLVVSTRTKSLQEQLFRSDLPFLTARLHPSLSVALLKGRENYACLRRWESVVGESSGGLDRDVLTRLAPFASWLFRTETGDIEEKDQERNQE